LADGIREGRETLCAAGQTRTCCRRSGDRKPLYVSALPVMLIAMAFLIDSGSLSGVLAQSRNPAVSESKTNLDKVAPGTALSLGQIVSRAQITNANTNIATDVVVYGATPSGILAAIECAKLGRQVVLLEPTQHVGGMMSNGLGVTDVYGDSDYGGLTAEFFKEVNDYYDGIPSAANGYAFEPHVAEGEFNSMLARYANITVVLGAELSLATMSGTTIAGLTASNGVSYQAKEYIDASYTGDLMAAAGVSYTVGRESTTQYNESIAGVGVLAPIASSPIDPYVTPGDPSSGLIAHVSEDSSGAVGSADSAVMAYSYRLCITTDPNNQIPFEEPPNYNPAEFAMLTRMFASATPLTASDVVSGDGLLSTGGLPGSKFDLNNGGTFPIMGTDEVGESFAYPDGSASVRQGIEAEQTRYIRALLYFLSHDSSVPQTVQAAVQTLGLCKDEFTDNGGWPHQIYVREARRMIGQYVLTLSDLERETTIPDAIGLGGYQVDSHVVHIVNQAGTAQFEPGPGGLPTITEYPLPYRMLTPKAEEATNLLVSVDVSASHVADDSVRVEPTYMVMGQAAGAAASIAIGQGVSVQGVPYSALAAQLLQDGQTVSVPMLTTMTLSFETQVVGTQSGSQRLYFTNTTGLPISISSIEVTGSDASSFVFANNCGSTLAAGQTCIIHGHFTPAALGPMTAALTLIDSAPGSPQSVALSGTGVSTTSVALSATTLSFGPVEVGKSSPLQFVSFMNTGTTNQTISDIGVTGADAASFSFENSCGAMLAAGANCTIQGHFAPEAGGAATATLTITDSAPGSPQTIVLSGSGKWAPKRPSKPITLRSFPN